jgi:hypothetical protein
MINRGLTYSLNAETGYGSFTQFYASRQKWQARFQFKLRAAVFGDAAPGREWMLHHLSGKEKEDECPPSLIGNLRLVYAVLAAASL